jgi:radical SAM superfamily enzyme YgiQ (UPF0313 family)
MKIAFVFPDMPELGRLEEERHEYPPLGILSLAAAVEAAGHQATVFIATNENYKFDFTGFDAVCLSIMASCSHPIIAKVRKFGNFSKTTGQRIFVGGVHPSIFPEQFVKNWDVDAVCIGEGEETLLELLNSAPSGYSRIKGICYFDSERNQIVRTEIRPRIADLSAYPMPARHLINEDRVILTDRGPKIGLRCAPVMFSRGCSRRCNFCANVPTKTRYRSALAVEEEINHLVQRYKAESLHLLDDSFTENGASATEIANIIGKSELPWSALSRLDNITPELLKSFRENNCHSLSFGMESGSSKILKAMNKQITVDQIREGIRLTFEAGILVKVFILHGFPGETMETTEETINLLEELHPYISGVSETRFVPLPGSYTYHHPEQFGIRREILIEPETPMPNY